MRLAGKCRVKLAVNPLPLLSSLTHPWRLLAAAMLLVGTPLAHATTPSGSGSDLVEVVLQAPALRAAAARVEAASARLGSAGRLPDPQIEGMASQMDGPMGEESDMWELTLRQPLPKRGERAADRARAQAVADMARAELAAMAGEMAAETAMALAEAEGAERRLKLLRTQVERLDAVLTSLNVRLSTGGTGRLADRLTVQTRIAAMELMLQEEMQMAEDARAGARGRLGLGPDASLPAYVAPAPEVIRDGVAPATLVAQARAREAAAMVGMARASARPMTALGLRLERERTRMGNEDIVGLAFMSEIPWRSRGYARAEARAAEAERDAAQSDAAAVGHRVSALLSRVARAQRLAETARRLSTETLSRLRAEYDAMIGTAGVAAMGQSTIFEVVELLEKETDAETQVIAAETAFRVASAELWRFAPADLFQLPTKDTP